MEQSEVLSLDDLRALYRKLYGSVSRSAETVAMVVSIIADITGVSGHDILSRARHKRRVLPRQLLYWALYEVLGFTLAEIGALMQRDHSTVSNGIAALEKNTTPERAEFIWQAQQRIRKEMQGD